MNELFKIRICLGNHARANLGHWYITFVYKVGHFAAILHTETKGWEALAALAVK